MPFSFEWDARKAETNLAKHGLSFREAAAAFLDPLSMMMPDLAHSSEEERYILMGRISEGRTAVVAYAERGDRIRIVSARLATSRERRSYEEGGWGQVSEEMLPEYDFSKAVRGKYARRFPKTCRAVVLEPDVAEAFRTSEEVNQALRVLARIARPRKSRPKRIAS